ncbi:MAG: hypothetical protein CMJ18_21080 [Phycisphaeraceae bacterium]|nr:hypothetical protein [Phycisphaeraceae bacterium]
MIFIIILYFLGAFVSAAAVGTAGFVLNELLPRRPSFVRGALLVVTIQLVLNIVGTGYYGFDIWISVLLRTVIEVAIGIVAGYVLVNRLTRRMRRESWRIPCAACGYDLRGNAAPIACPECGSVTDPAQDRK